MLMRKGVNPYVGLAILVIPPFLAGFPGLWPGNPGLWVAIPGTQEVRSPWPREPDF